jgi:hypothetical protein
MELVTGDKRFIQWLEIVYCQIRKPSELYDMVHTENFVLVDAKKKSSVLWWHQKKKTSKKLITDINFLRRVCLNNTNFYFFDTTLYYFPWSHLFNRRYKKW